MFEGRSAAVREIVDFWWVLLAATGVPAALTILALMVGVLWRPGPDQGQEDPRRQRWIILGLGAVLTPALIVTLLGVAVRLGERVTPAADPDALTVDVIGRQFWWEVRYPDDDIVTANEIHVPVGRQVRFRLASGDVIHSFWVPALAGKLDMIPGKLNELRIRAEEPGVYRGQCAEFCGVQHALMLLDVIVEPPAVFAEWVKRHQTAALEPTAPGASRGLRVFHETECGHCHTIKGITPELAMGAMGPDLTHFASRRRLGAGILENNRGNLGGWILSPQSLKPGNHMPASEMSAGDFLALLDFLETLR